jgi:predicted small lipoprotein YifL
MKRTLNALVAVALTGALTACGDNDEPDPIPEAETSSTTSPTEPTETATTPVWEDDYSPKQLQAYESALQRFESYEQRSESIWAAGRATAVAEDLFKEYFPSPYWQSQYDLLVTYEQSDVKTTGLATVYWSRPKTVANNALSVEIRQCVDFAEVEVTQDGKRIEGTKWTTKPHLRAVHLSKSKGYGWLIDSMGDPGGKKIPCKP